MTILPLFYIFLHVHVLHHHRTIFFNPKKLRFLSFKTRNIDIYSFETQKYDIFEFGIKNLDISEFWKQKYQKTRNLIFLGRNQKY